MAGISKKRAEEVFRKFRFNHKQYDENRLKLQYVPRGQHILRVDPEVAEHLDVGTSYNDVPITQPTIYGPTIIVMLGDGEDLGKHLAYFPLK